MLVLYLRKERSYAFTEDNTLRLHRLAFSLLQSLLDVPRDKSLLLDFVHLSFRDFLLDKGRSGQDFFVESYAKTYVERW